MRAIARNEITVHIYVKRNHDFSAFEHASEYTHTPAHRNYYRGQDHQMEKEDTSRMACDAIILSWLPPQPPVTLSFAK